MKTIVLLNNLFSADIIRDFDYLKKNLDMKKFNLISPLMFMNKNGKYDTDNFTLKLISNAIAIGNMYNEFGTIKSIAKENKITIYYGMAHTNVKPNNVLVINKVALDAQENLLDSYIKESNVTFSYVKSGEAEKIFKNIEEAVVYLNAL